MFRKNFGLRRRIAKGLSYRPVVTPTGIYLGRRMALQFDKGRIERVVQKIVRGLYYFEYGEALAAKTEVMTLFLSTKARFETAVGYAHQLGWGGDSGPGSSSTVAVAYLMLLRGLLAHEMLQQFAFLGYIWVR